MDPWTTIRTLTGEHSVAYRVPLTDICDGDPLAGLFLAQALYWTKTGGRLSDGWFYKSAKDWWNELRLSRRTLNRIRKLLKTKGFLREKRTGMVNGIVQYQLDLPSIIGALQCRSAKSDKPAFTSIRDTYRVNEDALAREPAPEAWNRVLTKLRGEIDGHTFDNFLKPTRGIRSDNDCLVVSIPGEDFRHYVTKYQSKIYSHLEEVGYRSVFFEVIDDRCATSRSHGLPSGVPSAKERKPTVRLPVASQTNETRNRVT
jgi:hypothetical protein